MNPDATKRWRLVALGALRLSQILLMLGATASAAQSAGAAWTSKGTIMPTARDGLAAAAIGATVYAVGGQTYPYPSVTSALEAYDPATNTFTTKASMPTARRRLGVAAASNGRLYAIGGENTAQETKNTKNE